MRDKPDGDEAGYGANCAMDDVPLGAEEAGEARAVPLGAEETGEARAVPPAAGARKCGLCRATGHNRRTCPRAAAGPQPAQEPAPLAEAEDECERMGQKGHLARRIVSD